MLLLVAHGMYSTIPEVGSDEHVLGMTMRLVHFPLPLLTDVALRTFVPTPVIPWTIRYAPHVVKDIYHASTCVLGEHFQTLAFDVNFVKMIPVKIVKTCPLRNSHLHMNSNRVNQLPSAPRKDALRWCCVTTGAYRACQILRIHG